MMRHCFLLLFLLSITLAIPSLAQQTPRSDTTEPSLTFEYEQLDTVADALTRLEKASGRKFHYKNILWEDIHGRLPVKTFETPMRLSALLKDIIRYSDPHLRYEISKGEYFFFARPTLGSGKIELPYGESGRIREVSFSDDSNLIASSDDQDRVTIWQTNRIPITQLKGVIGAFAFSPSGKQLLLGEGDNVVYRVLRNGKLARTVLRHKGRVVSVTHSASGNCIVSSGQDKVIKVQVKGVSDYSQIYTKEGVYKVTISPRGEMVAGVIVEAWAREESRRNLLIWSPATGKVLIKSTGIFIAATFSPDSTKLAALNLERKIMIWNVADLMGAAAGASEVRPATTIDLVSRWRDKPQDILRRPYTLLFTPDSQRLIWAGLHESTPMYSVETGNQIGEFPNHNNGTPFSAIAFSKNNKTIATGRDAWWSMPDKLQLWEAETQRFLFDLNATDFTANSVAFSPTQNGIVATGGSSIRVWDFNKRGVPLCLKGKGAVVFHPSGEFLATLGPVGHDREAIFWSADKGRILAQWFAHEGGIRLHKFSEDGRVFVTIGNEGTAKVWDVETQRLLLTLGGVPSDAAAFDISPDARVLAVRSWGGGLPNTVVVWDISEPDTMRGDRELLRKVMLESGRDDNFALSNKYFVYEVGQKLHLYELSTNSPVQLSKDHELNHKGVHPLFSPDGQWLVTELSTTQYIINASSGVVQNTLSGLGVNAAFTPNGFLVCQTPDLMGLNVYNPADGSRRFCKGSERMDAPLSFDAEGGFAGTLNGGSVRIWNLTKGKEALGLLAFGEESYIAYTPGETNYYFASKNSLSQIRLRQGENIYPFEQFELVLNRPDIVLSTLGLAPTEEIEALKSLYTKRLEKMGLTQKDLDAQVDLPELEPLRLSEKLVSDRRYHFEVRARDAATPLHRVQVYANGVPVFGSKGLVLPQNQGRGAKVPIDMVLTPGKNKIEVEVSNRKGATSFRQVETVECTAARRLPRLYALLIGVSKYKSPEYPSLTFPIKDATDMAILLRRLAANYRAATPSTPPLSPTYESVSVLPLRGEEVTRDAVMKARSFLERAEPEDTVIVLIAGHGVRDNNSKDQEYYFLTYDAVGDNLKKTAISFDDLEFLIDGLAARNKLLLMDTCNSGEANTATKGAIKDPKLAKKPTIKITNSQPQTSTKRGAEDDEDAPPDAPKMVPILGTRGATPAPGAPISKLSALTDQEQILELFVELRRDTGASIISAASAFQAANEGKFVKNGFFTYAVLQGLGRMEADEDRNGIITVSELKNYVGRTVLKMSGGRQRPTTRRENLTNDFTILGQPRE